MNFYIFNLIYFELNSFKLFILSRTDMADDVVRWKKRGHVAIYETVACHTSVLVRACVSVHVCACVHVCVHAYVCS